MQILGISLSLQSKFGSLTGDVSSYPQFFPGSAGKGLSEVFSNSPCKVLETFRAETPLSVGQRPRLLKMLPFSELDKVTSTSSRVTAFDPRILLPLPAVDGRSRELGRGL